VRVDGYRGQHLELIVPDLPQTHEGYTGCVEGNLATWKAPVMGPAGDDAFYGYGGPNRREEFWILDAEGTRLMIAAIWSTDSPRRNVSEMHDIVGSIQIKP
jgi:hypothetical protein